MKRVKPSEREEQDNIKQLKNSLERLLINETSDTESQASTAEDLEDLEEDEGVSFDELIQNMQSDTCPENFVINLKRDRSSLFRANEVGLLAQTIACNRRIAILTFNKIEITYQYIGWVYNACMGNPFLKEFNLDFDKIMLCPSQRRFNDIVNSLLEESRVYLPAFNALQENGTKPEDTEPKSPAASAVVPVVRNRISPERKF